MAFTNNILTTSGAALLTQATSSNVIVFTKCVSSTDVMTSETTNVESTSTWTGPSGSIASASATGTTARIIAAIGNQSTSSTVKSIGIVGRLASQSASAAIVIAFVSDEAASIYIPSTSEPDAVAQVAINLTLSQASSVQVTSSSAGSAALSDLERFVSVHKAGDAATGEAQTIRGAKTFTDAVSVGGLFSASGLAMFSSNVVAVGNVASSDTLSAQHLNITQSAKLPKISSGDINTVLTVPIGAIVAILAYGNSSQTNLLPGKDLVLSDDTTPSGGVLTGGGVASVPYTVPAGTYRIIMGTLANASTQGLVLAVRTA